MHTNFETDIIAQQLQGTITSRHNNIKALQRQNTTSGRYNIKAQDEGTTISFHNNIITSTSKEGSLLHCPARRQDQR